MLKLYIIKHIMITSNKRHKIFVITILNSVVRRLFLHFFIF